MSFFLGVYFVWIFRHSRHYSNVFGNVGNWRELDNVKPMKSGRVFIEVETKQQCENLLKTTKLLGYLPVKVSPHRTLNSSKLVIKCEELDTRNHCCQKNLHTIQSVRFNHQRTNYSKKDQYWIPEIRNMTVHSQPSKMFLMPEIWTYEEFM